jgi:uncharacterized membrane protein
VVGALLLVFGLNWLRKGLLRVGTYGLRGRPLGALDEVEEVKADGVDWTGFVLSFKGVLLEGLEVAFIVVTFGVTGHHWAWPPPVAWPPWSSSVRLDWRSSRRSAGSRAACCSWW